MSKSVKGSEPLVPGPLRLRVPVLSSLYSLRHFTQVSLETLNPPPTYICRDFDEYLRRDADLH